MKTLVLVFHPDMSASRANRPLAARAGTPRDATSTFWSG